MENILLRIRYPSPNSYFDKLIFLDDPLELLLLPEFGRGAAASDRFNESIANDLLKLFEVLYFAELVRVHFFKDL